ncbi:MFS transporter [Kordiimonas sediminis]|uniref:MFS transporter n=2 Tax=Kordiimonas sediminis TaxID=1735581 RepID=A0A919E6T8_9PROT|nr:MFS transporter [Kordiimonas sediminis]
MAAAAPFCFAIWNALLNNFAIEAAAFGGREIGILHSVREIPGFLAFTAIFLLLMIREQAFALLALLILGTGVAVTGFFPSEYDLYITTLMMSIGFHYFETIQMSLSLQWLPKGEAPKQLGRQLSAKSFASILAFGLLWLLLETLQIDYKWLFLLGGGVTVALTLFIWAWFPRIDGHTPQRKSLILRKRYWLFYALTFMGGARRQIFVVFAGFLLVQKFGFSAAEVAGLYLANHIVTTWAAPKLGALIIRFGERATLITEYIGLIVVFTAYAVVQDPVVAAILYVVDHLFFSFAIAQKSYLQKIADPEDIAATSSVSFSINHIAAVVIPATFGTYLWSQDPAYVFYAGAIMAAVSLLLSFNVPRKPSEGNEVVYGRVVPIQA